jgi:hypothetical protein
MSLAQNGFRRPLTAPCAASQRARQLLPPPNSLLTVNYRPVLLALLTM